MSRSIANGIILAGTLLIVAACASEPAQDDMGTASATQAGTPALDAADYTVVVRSTWTRQNHPFEYPEAGAISGPHFSGVIGASHDSSFSLYAEGAMPSLGIEKLSEEGKHSPLDEEIRSAMAGGRVGALFTTGPLRDFGDSLVATVRVSATHPLVSLVAMIAPSPDWFAGASAVSLMDGAGWVASRKIDLYAYDAGSDDGATYKAADKDANPKKPTTQARGRHFANGGTPVPVAQVVFTRR